MTTESLNRNIRAFQCASFPCNPRPFAASLGELIAERGTNAIRSDDAKALLWILMSQAYGQMARIDLADEWSRLDEVFNKSTVAA